MRARQRGYILIYVVAMVAAMTLILHELNQLRTGIPRQVERQINHVVQRHEALFLMDFVIAGLAPRKVEVDGRYLRFQRLRYEDPARLSELEDAIAQLKALLDALNFKIDLDGRSGAKRTTRLEVEGQSVIYAARDEPYVVKPGEREFAVRIVSDNALPDLNSLPLEAMQRYLVYLGLAADEALELAANIVDWRDKDDFRSAGRGAEAEYYLGLERPYPPRNGTVTDWQEVAYIKGVTPARLALLREHFSLRRYGNGRVLPDHLPVPALAALTGLSPEIVGLILKEYGRVSAPKPAPAGPVAADAKAGNGAAGGAGQKAAPAKEAPPPAIADLDIAEVLLTPDAEAFDRVVGLIQDTEGVRIEISGEFGVLTVDYSLREKRLRGRW